MANLINPSNNENKEGFNPNVDNSVKNATVSSGGKIAWYLTFILIIPIIIHIVMRNNLFTAQNRVNELASGIDVQLKKRRDTLVKLMDATKSYVKYEKSVLTDITKLRTMGVNNSNREEFNEVMNKQFAAVNAVFENYPDLKTDKLVQETMESASYLEREIGAARRLYNSEVRRFNQSLFTWPSNVVSASMHLTTLPFFAASETDRQDVSLNF